MISTTIRVVLAVLLLSQLSFAGNSIVAVEGERQEQDQRMQWWREARFGMFVHWGLYSGLAGEWDGKPVEQSKGLEWIQHYVEADTETYAAEAIPKFHPKPGFASQWAQLAKRAGCRYLVFTTKHHDGFALHDSQVTDFDAGSVLNRDLVEEIVEACREEGLGIGFYHSVIDWHHDQFAYADSELIPHPLRGEPYPNGERDHGQYIQYLHSQVDELISNYGSIDIIWWDYSVTDFQGERAWEAFQLMESVRKVQPRIVMNNRLFRKPEAGHSGLKTICVTSKLDIKYGDFMTPEQHVPDTGILGVDWETCMTMNNTWGYSKYDNDWKSTETILRTLIDIASKGGNFLLNVGPKSDGTIPDASVKRLEALGRWLEKNGEAIYGTTASPIDKPSWGRVTENVDDRSLYLHVFDWPENGTLKLSGLDRQVSEAVLLDGKHDIPISSHRSQVRLKLPRKAPDPIASVIRLRYMNE